MHWWSSWSSWKPWPSSCWLPTTVVRETLRPSGPTGGQRPSNQLLVKFGITVKNIYPFSLSSSSSSSCPDHCHHHHLTNRWWVHNSGQPCHHIMISMSNACCSSADDEHGGHCDHHHYVKPKMTMAISWFPRQHLSSRRWGRPTGGRPPRPSWSNYSLQSTTTHDDQQIKGGVQRFKKAKSGV